MICWEVCFCLLSGFSLVKVEPVGRWHKALCQRRRQKQTLSHTSLRSSSSEESDADLSDEEEDDENLLMTLDPKEWKVRSQLDRHFFCKLLQIE